MVKKNKIKITNFRRNSSFFFDIINYNNYIYKNKNQNSLKISTQEINFLKELIGKYKNEIEADSSDTNNKTILINPLFKKSLDKFSEVKEIKTNYGKNVLEVIEKLKTNNNKINLKNIQMKYNELYNKRMSLMTFSRILRKHLNIRYLKTTCKNPKLENNQYKYMKHFFIKGIIRGLKQKLKLIFIDETGFQLINNNYYTWRDDDILGGPKKDMKKKINMILAVDDNKIINCKLLNESVNSINFLEFLDELKTKIGEENIKDYLLILDNAKYHLVKKVKEYALKNNFKMLTNCPYYSKFNPIEFVFRAIKAKLYKNLFDKKKTLRNFILNIINENEFKKTIKKIFLKGLNIYYQFIKENNDENIDLIYKTI